MAMTPCTTPRRRRAAGATAVVAAAALLAACSDAPAPEQAQTTRASAPDLPVRSPSAPTTPSETGGGTAVEVQVGDTVLDGRLGATPAAQALVAQLPLTLTFSDLNGVEKTALLPQELPMDDMPEGDDPVPGDIGYYAPSGDLVLYYGEVGYWDGIARIGTFDSDLAVIAGQDEDFEATVRLAE